MHLRRELRYVDAALGDARPAGLWAIAGGGKWLGKEARRQVKEPSGNWKAVETMASRVPPDAYLYPPLLVQ